MSEGWLNICDGVLILLPLLSPMDAMSTKGCDLEGFGLLESTCGAVSLIFSDEEDLGIKCSLISSGYGVTVVWGSLICSDDGGPGIIEVIGDAKDTFGFLFK